MRMRMRRTRREGCILTFYRDEIERDGSRTQAKAAQRKVKQSKAMQIIIYNCYCDAGYRATTWEEWGGGDEDVR